MSNRYHAIIIRMNFVIFARNKGYLRPSACLSS